MRRPGADHPLTSIDGGDDHLDSPCISQVLLSPIRPMVGVPHLGTGKIYRWAFLMDELE